VCRRGKSEFLKIRNSCMQESRSAISRLDRNRPSAGTRVERSRRVGNRGTKSPVHMTAEIAISRYANFPTELRTASGRQVAGFRDGNGPLTCQRP
jgi:hypothetical protein